MIALRRPFTAAPLPRWLPVFGWLLAAGLVGWLAATQSLAVVIIGLFVAGCALVAAMTPLAAAAVLVIIAPMRTLIATEAQFQLPLDVGQIAFAVLVAAWAAHHIVFKRALPRLTWSPLYVPLLLFFTWVGLSGFNALSVAAWAAEWLKWLQIIILIAFVLDAAQQRRWEWLLSGLVLAGLTNALIGLYQFLGGSGADHLVILDRFFRAFGTFGQPNPFAGFLGLLAPLATTAAAGYSLLFWQRRTDWNLASIAAFYWVATGFIILGIGISWSRGAWLGFAASFGVVAFSLPRKVRYGLFFAGGIIGLVALLWFTGLLPASITERISSSTEEFFAFEDVRGVDITPENYAVVERLSHWQAALNMTRANPWLGVGMGNYEAAYPSYRLLNWDEPLGHAHNYYLNILAETGLIGLLVYGKVWIFIIWLTWRARQHPDPLSRWVASGLLGSWFYLAVHSFFDNLYVNNLFLHIGLMVGILAVLYRQATQSVKLRIT